MKINAISVPPQAHAEAGEAVLEPRPHGRRDARVPRLPAAPAGQGRGALLRGHAVGGRGVLRRLARRARDPGPLRRACSARSPPGADLLEFEVVMDVRPARVKWTVPSQSGTSSQARKPARSAQRRLARLSSSMPSSKIRTSATSGASTQARSKAAPRPRPQRSGATTYAAPMAGPCSEAVTRGRSGSAAVPDGPPVVDVSAQVADRFAVVPQPSQVCTRSTRRPRNSSSSGAPLSTNARAGQLGAAETEAHLVVLEPRLHQSEVLLLRRAAARGAVTAGRAGRSRPGWWRSPSGTRPGRRSSRCSRPTRGAAAYSPPPRARWPAPGSRRPRARSPRCATV